MRVLLVDDYQDVALACSHVLELLGHEVRCAFSGEAALALLPSFTPDIIVLDLDLPGRSGFEIAREVRSSVLGPRVFLAALSGCWEQDQRSIAAGFDLHVMKPASAAKLEAITSAAANRRVIA